MYADIPESERPKAEHDVHPPTQPRGSVRDTSRVLRTASQSSSSPSSDLVRSGDATPVPECTSSDSQGTSPVLDDPFEHYHVDPETGKALVRFSGAPVCRPLKEADVELIEDEVWPELPIDQRKPYGSPVEEWLGKWLRKPKSITATDRKLNARYHYILIPGVKQRPHYFDTRNPMNFLCGVNARLR